MGMGDMSPGCGCCGGGVVYPPSGLGCLGCSPSQAPITVTIVWRGGIGQPDATTTDVCVWTPAGTDPDLLASEFVSPWASNPTYPLGPGPTCPQYRVLGCALQVQFRGNPAGTGGPTIPCGSIQNLTGAFGKTVSCTPLFSVTWDNSFSGYFIRSGVAHQ